MSAVILRPLDMVHLSKGVPVTDSLAIAREFGRKHGNVLQSIDGLIKDGAIDRLDFKPIYYADEYGRKQRKIELTERGALIAMPFIGGKKSREGQTRLVDAFLAMRDELANPSGKWQAIRDDVSTSFRAIMDNLKAVRTEGGKETAAHHYSNEANMLSVVTFGRKGVDRNTLSPSELKLLEKIEAKDAYLIARGRSYQERKAELIEHVKSMSSQVYLIEA